MARPPKPTATKELAGTARGDRLNKAEPKPQRVLLPVPHDLPGPAVAHWRRLAAVVHGLGVMTAADEDAFRGMVEATAEVRELKAIVAAEGWTIETRTDKGGFAVKMRPEVAAISDLSRLLLNYWSRFGLTPADRARVSTLPDAPAEADPWDMLAAGPGEGAGRVAN